MRFSACLIAAVVSGLLSLTGCATAADSPGQSPLPPYAALDPVAVTVTRDGNRWAADFALDRDAPVWAFRESALLKASREPWRPQQWTVETPGVVMERYGFYDVLRAVDGGSVPRQVRIRLRPTSGDLEAAYSPALIFSDGSVALASDQFDLMPYASVAEVSALPQDLNGLILPGGPSRVTWVDRAGPVLFNGRRQQAPTAEHARTYVLFGTARLMDSNRLATVVDPGLPSWIGDEIGIFAPRLTDYYADRLGPGQTEKPTVMVSWSGARDGMTSMGGSVLPGLIVMSFEGTGVVTRSDRVLAAARWFIGHETAHFWLGQTVRYEYAREAWITEGGADPMAIRALAAVDPTYDPRDQLQGEVNDCITLAAGGSLANAGTRGEHRAYYACGAVFALAAEAAQRRHDGGDWFDFLRPLLDSNRDDGVLTRAEWLAAMTTVAGDAEPARLIARLLDDGAGEPVPVLAALFDRTGVAYRVDDGTLTLL